MPPYQSAAEKRRQRALETANEWSAPNMLDGFGLKERTGVGGRNLANADSIVRGTQAAPVPSHAYHVGDGPYGDAGGSSVPPPMRSSVMPYPPLAPLPPEYSAYPSYHQMAPSSVAPPAQPSPRPYNVVVLRQPPPPAQAQPPYAANPRQQILMNQHQQLQQQQQYASPPSSVGYEPVAQVAAAAVFDPNLFGNNTTPTKQHQSAQRQPSSSYAPHPLEYDGAIAAAAPSLRGHHGGHPGGHHGGGGGLQAVGGSSSSLLDEYYNRTRGPVLSDDDRAAIEDFFATDDFAMHFNAQAAAKRSQQQQQQQQQQSKPPHHVGAPVAHPRSARGSSDALPPEADERKYPVCHKCHAEILASHNGGAGGNAKKRNAAPQAAGAKLHGATPALRTGRGGGGGGGGRPTVLRGVPGLRR